MTPRVDSRGGIDISAAELRSRQFGVEKAEKDSEFRCPICNARCTKSPTTADEYGHLTDCPRRPEHLPRGGKTYKPTDSAVATDGGERR